MTQNYECRDTPYKITAAFETELYVGGLSQSSYKITVSVNGRYDGFLDDGCPANADLDEKIIEMRKAVEQWINLRLDNGQAIPR